MATFNNTNPIKIKTSSGFTGTHAGSGGTDIITLGASEYGIANVHLSNGAGVTTSVTIGGVIVAANSVASTSLNAVVYVGPGQTLRISGTGAGATVTCSGFVFENNI